MVSNDSNTICMTLCERVFRSQLKCNSTTGFRFSCYRYRVSRDKSTFVLRDTNFGQTVNSNKWMRVVWHAHNKAESNHSTRKACLTNRTSPPHTKSFQLWEIMLPGRSKYHSTTVEESGHLRLYYLAHDVFKIVVMPPKRTTRSRANCAQSSQFQPQVGVLIWERQRTWCVDFSSGAPAVFLIVLVPLLSTITSTSSVILSELSAVSNSVFVVGNKTCHIFKNLAEPGRMFTNS